MATYLLTKNYSSTVVINKNTFLSRQVLPIVKFHTWSTDKILILPCFVATVVFKRFSFTIMNVIIQFNNKSIVFCSLFCRLYYMTI